MHGSSSSRLWLWLALAPDTSPGWGGDGPSAVLSIWGWSGWVQGRMQPGLACLHRSSAAQPCLVLCSTAAVCSTPRAAAAGFGEKRELPAWWGGLQSIPALQHHCWGWKALKSPSPDQLVQLRPAPSPGRGTPARACLSVAPEAPMGATLKETKVPWGDASPSRRACGAESQAGAAAHQWGAGGGRRRVARCGVHLWAGSRGPASISTGCALRAFPSGWEHWHIFILALLFSE